MEAKENIEFPKRLKGGRAKGSPVRGSAGLATQIPGGAATVSAVAAATGGISAGGFVETDR